MYHIRVIFQGLEFEEATASLRVQLITTVDKGLRCYSKFSFHVYSRVMPMS